MRRATLLAALCLLLGSAQAAMAQVRGQEPLDVLILLDLSDRIAPKVHPLQPARDSAVLRAVANAFGDVVRRHGFLYSRDRLRVIYLDAPEGTGEPAVDVAEMNRRRQVVVRELPRTLDRFVIEASAPLFMPKTYTGADFWGWFKDAAVNHLVPSGPSDPTRRIVVIVTDGYLNFSPRVTNHRPPGTQMRIAALRKEKDWRAAFPKYALASVGRKFPGVSAVLLELAPEDRLVNVAEMEMVRTYWKSWLEDMGIQLVGTLGNTESPATVSALVTRAMGG